MDNNAVNEVKVEKKQNIFAKGWNWAKEHKKKAAGILAGAGALAVTAVAVITKKNGGGSDEENSVIEEIAETVAETAEE